MRNTKYQDRCRFCIVGTHSNLKLFNEHHGLRKSSDDPDQPEEYRNPERSSPVTAENRSAN